MRAKRIRARRAAAGGSSLAVCVILAVLLLGAEKRSGPGDVTATALDVSAAQAMDEPDRGPRVRPAAYTMSMPPEVPGAEPSPDLWTIPLRTASLPPVETTTALPVDVPVQEAALVQDAQPLPVAVPSVSPPAASAEPLENRHTEHRAEVKESASSGSRVADKSASLNVLFEHTSLADPTVSLEAPKRPAAEIAAAPQAPILPSLRSLSGKWAGHTSACSPRSKSSYLPLALTERGAKAGDASCTFGKVAKNGSRWTVGATCRAGDERWIATVHLAVAGNMLTWSSARGAQTYLRCK